MKLGYTLQLLGFISAGNASRRDSRARHFSWQLPYQLPQQVQRQEKLIQAFTSASIKSNSLA